MPKDFPDWTTQLSYASTVLFAGTLVGGAAPKQIDISLMSSVYISASHIGSTSVVTIDFIDALGNTIITEYVTADDGDITQVALPAIGETMQISNPIAGNTIAVNVSGSNRQVSRITNIGYTSMPRSFSKGSVAWTAGFPQRMSSSDGLPNYTNMNGQCTLTVQTLGVAGVVFAQFVNPLGAETYIQESLDVAAGGVSLLTISHPATNLRWYFRPDTSVASGSVTVALQPGAP